MFDITPKNEKQTCDRIFWELVYQLLSLNTAAVEK